MKRKQERMVGLSKIKNVSVRFSDFKEVTWTCSICGKCRLHCKNEYECTQYDDRFWSWFDEDCPDCSPVA